MNKILVVTLMLLMIASNCFATLNNNSYANQNKKSQRQVMHDFMQTLDKSTTKNWLNALDEATNKASEGKFQTLAIAVNSFINDYNKNIRDSDGNITDDSAKEFLLKYCGIDLSNEDVGAIIGKDAGESLIELTAESIIPENVDNIIYLDKLWNESPVSLSKINELDDVLAVRLPMSTLNFDKRGVNFVVANYEILDNKDKKIVNGLYNWWIEGALDLIEKSYGLRFSNDELHQIIYADSFKIFTFILGAALDKNTLAAAGKNGNNLVLYINKKYFEDNFEIKLNPSGKFEHQFLDRTIAHELTHAIMAAKIPSYSPNDYLFVIEGLAELTVGADDTRNLIKLLKNPERLANSFQNPNKSEYGYYAAGYMFFRYFAKQVADSQNVKNNQPMTFSQPVEIGSFGFNMRSGGIYIKGANYVSEEPKKLYSDIIYSKGIAKFGNNDEIYVHYDYRDGVFKIGSNDIKNTIPIKLVWSTILKINSNNIKTMYFIRKDDSIPEIHYQYILIGRDNKGNWVKYFNTEELCKKYMGRSSDVAIQKIDFKDDMIIAYYARSVDDYDHNFYSRKVNERGEFRFKWDESAQWFGVEHIIY